MLDPLPPLHSSPPYPLYSQITSKPRSDPTTTHLHKNLPWLSSIECSPIPQLSVPSIIFPQPTFPAYFPHITHPSFTHPLPDTSPLWSFPYRNYHKDPVFFSISKMLFVPLCLPNPPSPIYQKFYIQGLRANAPPSASVACFVRLLL